MAKFLMAPFSPPWLEVVVPASAERGPLASADPSGTMPPETLALAVAFEMLPVYIKKRTG